MEVGDDVFYTPGVFHALQRDRDGGYPWVIGRRHAGGVEELHGNDLNSFINEICRSPSPAEARRDLVLIQPCAFWLARVTSVYEDLVVDLDVQSSNGGVTLQYERVPVDPTGKRPHSCHKRK